MSINAQQLLCKYSSMHAVCILLCLYPKLIRSEFLNYDDFNPIRPLVHNRKRTKHHFYLTYLSSALFLLIVQGANYCQRQTTTRWEAAKPDVQTNMAIEKAEGETLFYV